MRILGDDFNIIKPDSAFYKTDRFQPVLLWNPEYVFKPSTESNVDTYTPSPSVNPLDKVTPQGTNAPEVMAQAPNPEITIAGVKKKAGIVVDISTNILYRYDKDGNPVTAYQIASGKKSTPTDRGIRIVTHKETYPYRGAPRSSKRRRSPRDYGPFIICLNKLDPQTGEQSSTGEFIHGCRSYSDTFEKVPGRYVSHGCMRMDNDVITVLAQDVQKGEIVIIK